jgi:hypothetical protein
VHDEEDVSDPSGITMYLKKPPNIIIIQKGWIKPIYAQTSQTKTGFTVEQNKNFKVL